MANKRIGILHLGSKGASPMFAQKTFEILQIAGYDVELLNQEMLGKTGVFRSDRHLGALNKLLMLAKVHRTSYLERVISHLKLSSIQVVILLFPHPWDLALVKKIRREQMNIKFIRILHDAKRHPGDSWPTQKWINDSMKVDSIVTLSAFVSNQVKESTAPIFVGGHPSFPILDLAGEYLSSIPLDLDYDLIAGRLRKYQNTTRTANNWLSITQTPPKVLVIAGKLNLYDKFTLKKDRRIIRIKKEISDFKFQSLIAHASLVICFYKEASQSGIVAMAQTLGVPVVVSDVGALPEQIEKYGGGTVIKDVRDLELLDFVNFVKANRNEMDADYSRALTRAISSLN